MPIGISNRQFYFFVQFISQSLFLLLAFVANAQANDSKERISLSNQVQQLLTVSNEVINPNTVNQLSDKILSNSDDYSNDVIAKISLLSAIVASNQGDINNVLLFAEKGLSANSLDKTIKLSLLLKLAEAYAAKKQFTELLALTEKAVEESTINPNLKYNLLALSYRSVAFAMLGQHQKALEDLKKVEQGLSKSEFSEHIELLTILALAYHHLSDYQTSLTMQLKILKFRFDMGQTKHIDQTYLYLGYAYFYLDRLDDAYNAFWEAKQSAEKKSAPINIAHAEKGLGVTLLTQNYFRKSLPHLQHARELFSQHEMFSSGIESSVALAKAKLNNNDKEGAYALLTEVVAQLNGEDISPEYVGFYRMLAEMYFTQENYQMAYQWLVKYSQVLVEKLKSNKKSANLVNSPSRQTIDSGIPNLPIDESKRLAVKLAENSELSSSFVEKYNKQSLLIISLLCIVVLLFLILVGFFVRLRAQRINLAYEEVEKPIYVMTGPIKTKFHYQKYFKKSRHFQYPLGVGYLLIENWQELVFHFNKKTINEVMKDIATVINQQIAEFDYAGLLSEDEYLLLFEYQNNQEVDEKLGKLVQAINTRSFASLGDFSVIMKYSLNTPGFKDIDPYLFLAGITESVKNEQVNQLKDV